jgi:hypothetical protein
MLAVVNFLNSREKATVLWILVLTAYVWRRDHSIGGSIFSAVRALFAWKLTILWVAAATYTAAIICAAYELGLWHTTAIKETIYWFCCTGMVLVGSATTEESFDATYAKRLARKAIRFTLVLEFLVGVYVLPLVAELVLVPLIALLIGMQVVSENNPDLASAKKLVNGVLMLIGVGGISWVIASAATDLHGLLTREHAERLILAPVLTLAFVPFVYGIWWWSRWDYERIMRQWRDSKDTRRATTAG